MKVIGRLNTTAISALAFLAIGLGVFALSGCGKISAGLPGECQLANGAAADCNAPGAQPRSGARTSSCGPDFVSTYEAAISSEVNLDSWVDKCPGMKCAGPIRSQIRHAANALERNASVLHRKFPAATCTGHFQASGRSVDGPIQTNAEYSRLFQKARQYQ